MGKAKKRTNLRQITKEQWEILVDSFRDFEPPKPGAFAAASKAAGVTTKTAAKTYKVGVSYLGKEPIKSVLMEEKMAARAASTDVALAAAKQQTQAQMDRAYQEAEKARRDVVRARRQEGELVRAQRGNLVAMVSITGQVLRGAIKQVKVLEEAIATGVDPLTEKPLSVKDRVDLLWKVNRIVRQTASASADVIRMERLLLGEPTEIVGTVNMGDMSEDEALADIYEAYEAAKRVEARRNGLTLIDGGKPNGKVNGSGS